MTRMKASPDSADPKMQALSTHRITVRSPIGVLEIEGNDDAVTRIELPPHPGTTGRGSTVRRARREDQTAERGTTPEPLARATRQLEEYFAGTRTEFDIPIDLRGTPFQRQVWTALAEIPYGKTVSYAELAEMVGRPGACRAVGQANGSNPIPIVLPCHRVVGSGGGIGGYGGGLDMKRRLLELEGCPFP
jgi:methylated-DNA-[protein]-cysteine S-methyltransferase